MFSPARRGRSITPFRANGSAPPRPMKISAVMFVATATWGSIPNSIITETVISDKLAVKTLVKKKIRTRLSHSPAGIRPS
jgi:hypothetical protein